MKYEILPMQARHVPQIAALERLCFSDPWNEAAVGGELRAAAAVQQELCAELEERTADNAALREKLEAGLSDEELERLARERLGLVKPGDKIFYFTTDREG